MTQKETSQSYLKQNLRYLLILRSIALGTQVLALGLMHFAFSLPIPVLPITLLIIVLMLFTVYSWKSLQQSDSIGTGDYMVQLIVDILSLSLLIYFTGGSTNPFIFFFILPITFAAASLKFKQTCIIACLAAVSYTVLMFFHVPLLQHSQHHEGFDLHVWGMWYGFLVSAGLVTYFVSRIGATVHKRNRALAIVREENLRADQVLALGTLAAGTAHELGTPLSTMAVLTKELEYEHQANPDTFNNLKLLRQQIDRCKSILSKMAVNAGTAHAESGESVAIKKYITDLIKEWKTLRPDSTLEVILDDQKPDVNIISDLTVSQSIINVLNNAADAAEEKIQLTALWDNDLLTIEIQDDGGGIDPAILINLNQPVISNKEPMGMGIGLFLAQITLNRLGGQLDIRNAKPKGTKVTIQLPLYQFRTDA